MVAESRVSMSAKQPEPRFLHAMAVVGHKFYVWGGHGGHSAKTQTATMECFDATSETWQEPSTFHSSIYGMAVASDETTVYSYGGETDYDASSSLYAIDTTAHLSREIVPVNPKNAPKRTRSGMICFNQQLVIQGGYSGQKPAEQLLTFHLKKSEFFTENNNFSKIDARE